METQLSSKIPLVLIFSPPLNIELIVKTCTGLTSLRQNSQINEMCLPHHAFTFLLYLVDVMPLSL